ncbi:MAG: hypothetical protein Q8O09_01925 [Bacillota bacterium]|nr:hypothetical protein [Bacillota bacterium]
MPIRKISFEKGAEDLAKALEEYGYELTPQGEQCDAYLYSEGKGILKRAPGASAALPGTFLVNTAGLNAKQVAKILETGAYSPLFGE